MMKNSCELINDLLPLYADNVCSEESRQIVAEHLAGCAGCRAVLEKMNRDISVDPSDDIAVIKRIKRRLRIEKAVTTAVVLAFAAALMATVLFSLLHTVSDMDYYKKDIAQNVLVQEDEDGNLWMIRENEAVESVFTAPVLMDADGHTMEEDAFDKEQVTAIAYTLLERSCVKLGNPLMEGQTEQQLLFNINDKENLDTVYYYDRDNDEMHVLWERGN